MYFSAIMYGRNFKGTYHMLLGGTEKKDYLPVRAITLTGMLKIL